MDELWLSDTKKYFFDEHVKTDVAYFSTLCKIPVQLCDPGLLLLILNLHIIFKNS